MNDLQTLQAEVVHLSLALRLLDRVGAGVAGAQIDMALHNLKHDLDQRDVRINCRDYE